MERLTVVLMAPGPINLGEWHRELREAGFDLILDPTLPMYDDPRSVPVEVCGHNAVIEFELAPASDRASWFPLEMLRVRKPTWVALFEWRESEPFERAAAVAAAAALAKVYAGVIFDTDGLRSELPVATYRRARELFSSLPIRPRQAEPEAAADGEV